MSVSCSARIASTAARSCPSSRRIAASAIASAPADSVTSLVVRRVHQPQPLTQRSGIPLERLAQVSEQPLQLPHPSQVAH
eukprot:15554348-Heterocapsa_arctica.AAC.1